MKEDLKMAKKEIKELKEKSFAMEILQDYKKANKRMFWIIIVILTMWFITIGYLVWLLNDIGTIEVSQDNTNGYNNYIGNDGDIINGKTNN